MIEVWGRRTSSNVQAVVWCLQELKLDFKRYDIGHRFGGNKTPEFLALNPNGLVPVIRDGANEPIFEAGAILRYLAERYGMDASNGGFWPRDVAARAQVDKWAEWSKVNVALGFTAPIFWKVVRTPPSKQDPVAIQRAMKNLDTFLDIAEAQLAKHAFLAGEAFTLADIQFGHVLFRYFDIDIERKDRPALSKYYEALKDRQEYRDHVMVDYEELRAVD